MPRDLAPVALLRALREEGPAAALRQAETLVAATDPDDASRLAVVAAGIALDAADRPGAEARARAVIDMAPVPAEVLAAAIEIAAVAGLDGPRDSWLAGAVDRLLGTAGGDDDGAVTAMSRLARPLAAWRADEDTGAAAPG